MCTAAVRDRITFFREPLNLLRDEMHWLLPATPA